MLITTYCKLSIAGWSRMLRLSGSVATHYVNNTPTSGVQFQRPLCPFPQVARYTVGDPNNADSFKCGQDEFDHDPRDQPN